MLHIAICDDSRETIEQIEQYVEKIHEKEFSYDVFFSAEELYGYATNQKKEYDVFLLDIEMGGISGVDVAKLLRREFPHALFVFLTSHAKYVYDVFEVITFDFIVKPLTYERFQTVIKKMVDHLGVRKTCFRFSYKHNDYSIPFQSILYIEKNGRTAYIHTDSAKVYQCNLTIEAIWKQLDQRMFASIRNSCIVNLACITEIAKEEIRLKSGETIFAGRQYKTEIKRSHMLFLKQEI